MDADWQNETQVTTTDSRFENPLLWPILALLKTQPNGWKVHTLAAHLQQQGFIQVLDEAADKDLFKRNFLIMNALYQLQEQLYPERWLQVLAMDICLLDPTEQNRLDPSDPLRDYYQNWQNYQADHSEIKRLLNAFWQRYRRHIGETSNKSMERTQAYRLFGLEDNALPSEVRRQWRKLAMRWHPDRPNGSSERFRQLCEAWHVLRKVAD